MIKYGSAGKVHTDTDAKRAAIECEIDRLEWHPLPASAPACQGWALGRLIGMLDGSHKQVAWNGVLADRYGLLGLETHYPESVVRSYWLDTGTGVTFLAQDFRDL